MGVRVRLGRILSVLVVAFAAAAATPAAAAKGERIVAFVAAEDAGRLVAVDVAKRRAIGSVRVAAGPHNVDWGGNEVLVTSPPAGRVTVVDARTLRVRHVFSGMGFPHDVERAGRWAYVTDEARAQLIVLDLRRMRVAARMRVPARPHDLAIAGHLVVVTHRTRWLTLVDRRRLRIVARIPAGGDAHDIARGTGSTIVYVTYWDRPGVGAIDLARRTLLWQRRFGDVTHHVVNDPYGARVWISDHAGGRIFVASKRGGSVVRDLRGCPGAHHVAVATQIRVVAACHEAGTLAVFAPGRRIGVVRVGAGPHGVAVGRIP